MQQMICTVSTVKDSAANVERFVRRNLAAGVDHMFVFLEGAKHEIGDALAYLQAHEDVSVVRSGPRYWQGRRPPGLNQRQVVNANLVNTLLATVAHRSWLFHLDGDECLDIDRSALLALDDDVRCLRLTTLEAVSVPTRDREVDEFKRLLDDNELHLLTVLGVIPAPSNVRYFNGHVMGKPGMRPDLDYRLRIHKVLDYDAEELEPFVTEDQHVLHYESFSSEEFVRKWLAHLSSGPSPRFSANKDQVRGAVSAVLANPVISVGRKEELLEEIYRRRVQDDVEVLRELGYLVSPSPDRHAHQPDGFRGHEKVLMRQLLGRLRESDKRTFTYNSDGLHPFTLLEQLRNRLDPDEEELGGRIEAALANARASRLRRARHTPEPAERPRAG